MSFTPENPVFTLPDDAQFVRNTAGAVLFRFSDAYSSPAMNDKNELWIPKSVCLHDTEKDTLEIQKWWAEKNELC